MGEHQHCVTPMVFLHHLVVHYGYPEARVFHPSVRDAMLYLQYVAGPITLPSSPFTYLTLTAHVPAWCTTAMYERKVKRAQGY